jgi:membrane fusion protein, multidrug efflux system
VPISAVSTGTDGVTTVTTLVGIETRRVSVHVGVSADGYVAVVPLNGASLHPGDRVVVGQR